MKGGGKEPYSVPIHDDGGVLTKKYLHEMEIAVRARTPLAGAGINIVKTNNGSTIKLSTATTCQILEFNFCNNGIPDKIAILAVVTKPGIAIYDQETPVSYVPITTAEP